MSSLRIAITQPPASPNPTRTGRSHFQMIREAARTGARLILFPERHFSGYAKEQLSS